MAHRSGCILCGEPLVYLHESQDVRCGLCGTRSNSQGAVRFARRYLEAPLKIERKTVCRFHKLDIECLAEDCRSFCGPEPGR